MVERKEYLDQLWAWKDERQIKVVTGIRRCGKSVLLEQYQQRLLANGVAPEQIISINFENLDYEPLKDYMRLYNYLKERLCVDKMTFTIENIVYLELSRRGGKVNIGKYGSTEVDFVTQKEGVLTYYQVTVDMTAEETFEREMRPLRSIQDNYEKIVLTLDRFSLGNYDGIKVMNTANLLFHFAVCVLQ